MLDIKELTMKHHKDAERQGFVKILMSGEIDHKLYATYLYNQGCMRHTYIIKHNVILF